MVPGARGCVGEGGQVGALGWCWAAGSRSDAAYYISVRARLSFSFVVHRLISRNRYLLAAFKSQNLLFSSI